MTSAGDDWGYNVLASDGPPDCRRARVHVANDRNDGPPNPPLGGAVAVRHVWRLHDSLVRLRLAVRRTEIRVHGFCLFAFRCTHHASLHSALGRAP
jgi:hypothetical protein